VIIRKLFIIKPSIFSLDYIVLVAVRIILNIIELPFGFEENL